MAITTVDGVIAGMMPPSPIFKTGIAMAAAGGRRWYSPWYAGGLPGASTATAIGVNGEAVIPTLGASVGGRVIRQEPGGGEKAYFARLIYQASQTGAAYLLDRVWHNSGLSATLTTLQSITPAAIPSRDMFGLTNGTGLIPGIEWSGTGGAGTPTCTLTYTNQDGTTGRTGTLTAVTTPPIGTVELFDLAAGDNGVRAITGFQMSATRTSGAYHLCLYRLVGMVAINAANTSDSYDAVMGGFIEQYPNSVLQLAISCTGTTATNIAASYVETQG